MNIEDVPLVAPKVPAVDAAGAIKVDVTYADMLKAMADHQEAVCVEIYGVQKELSEIRKALQAIVKHLTSGIK